MNPETRKQLGLPPMPLNDNHFRDANYERMTTVPVCGIAAIFAFGIVCGMAAVMLYHLIF